MEARAWVRDGLHLHVPEARHRVGLRSDASGGKTGQTK